MNHKLSGYLVKIALQALREMKQKLEQQKLCCIRDALFLEDGHTERNVLESVSAFANFSRNGVELELDFFTGTTIPDNMLDFIFQLVKDNMQSLYENSWGWKDREKKNELSEECCRFIVARLRDEARTPVAFTHFRFTLEEDIEVLYCYEVQLSPGVQRKVIISSFYV